MPRSSKADRDFRDSDLEEYEYRYYRELRKGSLKVEISHSRFRCPYCYVRGKQDYRYEELLRHASIVSKDSEESIKEKAKHLALESYIKKYIDLKSKSEPEKYIDLKNKSEPEKYVELKSKSIPTTKTTSSSKAIDNSQLFVWPWVGIVANIRTELKDGRNVGDSGKKLKEEFASRGLNPMRVHPLWSYRGHSGFAVIEFNKDWAGFQNAMTFEKEFEVNSCGKKDYIYSTGRNLGDKLYGWVARDDDYNSGGLIGEHLKKHGDLKSVSDKEAEDRQAEKKLVSTLANTLEVKRERLKEMECKYNDTNKEISRFMSRKEGMIKSFNQEIRRLQQSEHDHFEKILHEHQNMLSHLEGQKKKLDQRAKQLEDREFQNENEQKKLHEEREMNKRATLEQKKADDMVSRLADEQRKEKEQLHRQIIDLEKKLDAKQALELEIERLRGAQQVMKHMGEDDEDLKKKMNTINEELQDKEDELEGLEQLNQALIVMERKCNDELQEARKELVIGLNEVSSRAFIGVKRMGELDAVRFRNAAKKKLSDEDEPDVKAVEMCSLWEDHLSDPEWHPFRIVTEGGRTKELIDEEDEKLKTLKDGFGEEVYGATVTALTEMNEYNPSGRYPVPELWNFKEKRRASLKEAVSFILKKMKTLKRKRK